MTFLRNDHRDFDLQKEAEKYRNGEISKEEYDRLRYTYPEVEVQRTRDALDELKKRGIE